MRPGDLVRADPLPARGRTSTGRAGRHRGREPISPCRRETGGRWRGAAARAHGQRRRSAPPQASAIAQPGPHPAPAGVTLSGANPVTHVRVTITLTATSWAPASGRWPGAGRSTSRAGDRRPAAGGTEVTGAWDARRAGPVSIPASAPHGGPVHRQPPGGRRHEQKPGDHHRRPRSCRAPAASPPGGTRP